MSESWHNDIGFSERLQSVMKMQCRTSTYKAAHPSLPATEAQEEATAIEVRIYGETSSAEAYEQRIEDAASEIQRQSNKGSTLPEEEEEVETEIPSDGIEIGRYRNASYIQDGLFSTVYKAVPPHHIVAHTKVVALKVTVPSMMEPPHDSKREARILLTATSSRVIPLIESFNASGARLVLVLPFMPYDLDRLLQRRALPKDYAKTCLRDLFSALVFIHSRGIIHRDIKPSNILLKSPHGPAYLSDFGIAWAPKDPGSEPVNEKITDVGTTCYRPPELLFGNKRYGCSLDLWAAGCTAAEVFDLDHNTLFDSGELGSDLALVQSHFKKLGTPNLSVWPEAAGYPDWGKMEFYDYPPKPWPELLPNVSEVERDMVSKLVIYESGARMTADQVLEHPYFTE